MPQSRTIRRSAIAGSWFPDSERGLASTVDDYLAHVSQSLIPGNLLGLISPHAGYAYSGQTAAHAYRQLQGRKINTVILIGPSHRAWVGDYAVNAEDAYETPLGLVHLDKAFIGELEQSLPLQRIRADGEHSLEIQLPFLQRQLGDFLLVPIMTSADDPPKARRLAAALAETVRKQSNEPGRIVLVASSDLHHIDNYDEVVRRDQQVVEAISAYDLDTLTTLLMAPGCSVCGRMPILTVLQAARELGADSVRILDHTNSGNVTGQRRPGQYTVGYMAAAIYKSQ